MARKPTWDDVPRGNNGRFLPRNGKGKKNNGFVLVFFGIIIILLFLLFL